MKFSYFLFIPNNSLKSFQNIFKKALPSRRAVEKIRTQM